MMSAAQRRCARLVRRLHLFDEIAATSIIPPNLSLPGEARFASSSSGGGGSKSGTRHQKAHSKLPRDGSGDKNRPNSANDPQPGGGGKGSQRAGGAQPRWRPDGSFPVSPAFAEMLHKMEEVSEEAVVARIQQHSSTVGKHAADQDVATSEDYERLAEAIEAYLTAAPTVDEELDGVGDADRALLEGVATAIREEGPGMASAPSGLSGLSLDGDSPTQPRVLNIAPPGRLPWECLAVDEEGAAVHWAVDLTDGRAADPWRNARLSDEAKAAMFAVHKRDPEGAGAVEALAAKFRLRQQRVMAILALKEMEAAAQAAGEGLHEELFGLMEEEVHACTEVRGSGERHHVTLPSFPAYAQVDPAAVIGRLEAALGRPAEDISEEELTPALARQVLGMRAVEEQEEAMAAREEADAVGEFRQRLEFNLGKAGRSVSRVSRRTVALRRPREGWSLAVTPLGAGAGGEGSEPYVAEPDGERRPLNPDEQLLLERKVPRRRRRAL